MESQLINYLGKNSYPAIVNAIVEKIQSSKAETLNGNQLLSNLKTTLFESITPMLDVKEFTTNAEKIAPSDTGIVDIINFVGKNVGQGDLNFLVNMAKEEHFKNILSKGGYKPEDTIKNFKSLFDEPTSVIEQAITNGLLDELDSNLLMEIKTELKISSNPVTKDPEKFVKINENFLVNYQNSLVMYNPVGISMEDIANNRVLLLTESDVLSFDRQTNDFNKLDNSEIQILNIPEGHKKMMTAIQNLVYNPEKETFKLNEKWDFDIQLNKDGEIEVINEDVKTLMKKEHLTQFLLESINHYENLPVIPTFFNKQNYLNDADNMILLVENFGKLIKIDKLKTIKNLNESTYVILGSEKPKLIAGSKIKESVNYNSFVELNESCNNILGNKINDLFENQLSIEAEFTKEKFGKIQELKESEKELNELLNEVNSQLNIAAKDSPIINKLNENKSILEDKLLLNLNEQTHYLNNHKLYV